MGRDFSFQWQPPSQYPMGWDGEIGPGTSLYTFLAIKNQLTINEIMKKNIYPDYHKIRISEQGVV